MLSAEKIRNYFYTETRDLAIESIELVETKNSYFDTLLDKKPSFFAVFS